MVIYYVRHVTKLVTYWRKLSILYGGSASSVAINYTYDNDEMLASAGDLTASCSPTTGRVSGTTLGSVTDTWTYNSFGELTGYDLKYAGTTLYA